MEDSYWVERAQSAEAKLKTIEDAYRPALERVKEFKTNFGVREKSDGEIDIDFEKFVDRLGAAALDLSDVINEKYPVKQAKKKTKKKS